MIGSTVILAVIFIITAKLYSSEKGIPAAQEKDLSIIGKASYNKFYIDELYNMFIVRPLHALSEIFHKVIDTWLIDGIVNSVNKSVLSGSKSLRLVQGGNVGYYIFAMVFRIIAILLFHLIL